jgi:hypothetical protein
MSVGVAVGVGEGTTASDVGVGAEPQAINSRRFRTTSAPPAADSRRFILIPLPLKGLSASNDPLPSSRGTTMEAALPPPLSIACRPPKHGRF